MHAEESKSARYFMIFFLTSKCFSRDREIIEYSYKTYRQSFEEAWMNSMDAIFFCWMMEFRDIRLLVKINKVFVKKFKKNKNWTKSYTWFKHSKTLTFKAWFGNLMFLFARSDTWSSLSVLIAELRKLLK